MASRRRLAIRGIESHPVRRVLDEHTTGARKIRPLVEYQRRPLDFLVDVLKFPRHRLVWSELPGYDTHRWDGTVDPLAQVCRVLAGDVPGKRHVAIEAATGTQKTYTAAGLVLWFIASFQDALAVTTAPKEGQLRVGLWKEIGELLPAFRREFPQLQSLDLKLRMNPVAPEVFDSGSTAAREKWAAIGWCAGVDANSESAVRSQGFHAEHMLIVIEEMPGMDPSTVTALKNTCTAPHNIIIGQGNPDNQLDPLHQFSQSPGVEAIRISAYDHPNVVCDNPNVVPGATSRQFIADKRAEYGETGPLFLSRVRGLSPKEAHNSLIKHAWLEAAAHRWEDDERRAALAEGPRALGVDPAQSENGDRCALARWQGAVCVNIEHVRAVDALAFGEKVWAVMQDEEVDAARVGVDTVGIGSNVVNYLRRVLPPGKAIVSIEGGAEDAIGGTMKSEVSRPIAGGREYRADANQFLNMRAQVYWQLAQDLAQGLIAVPRHTGLWAELLAVTYSTDGGVVRVEKKAAIKKKLGRSPDFADALVYGNWVRARALPRSRPNADRQPGQARRLEVEPDGRLVAPSKPDPYDIGGAGLVASVFGPSPQSPSSRQGPRFGRYRVPFRQ